MKDIKNINWSVIITFWAGLSLILGVVGCGGTQGETSADRARRWKAITRSNMGQINADIDAILLMDKRSKLTDKYIRD